MSREVRRVPLDWKHPTKPNPYWQSQRYAFGGVVRPSSRLHPDTECFVSLMGDYPASRERWLGELSDAIGKRGFDWTWDVRYHLTGYQGRDDARPAIHPWTTYADDGETEVETWVESEDHLQDLLLARIFSEKPNPAEYMPVWTNGEATGWCLYETVSEGTPTTPIFATAEKLIDHLATVGQDYDQTPMRRSAAETLVTQGFSLGSLIVKDGAVLDSARDADLIAKAAKS